MKTLRTLDEEMHVIGHDQVATDSDIVFIVRSPRVLQKNGVGETDRINRLLRQGATGDEEKRRAGSGQIALQTGTVRCAHGARLGAGEMARQAQNNVVVRNLRDSRRSAPISRAGSTLPR